MIIHSCLNKMRRRRVALAVLLAVSLFTSEAILTALWSQPAFAGNGNGGGNGNGNGGGNGGNGNGNGNGNGGSNGGGNGNGNGHGNGNGNGDGNGDGNGSGGGAASADDGAAPDVEDANSALGLREAGVIRSLEDVFKTAELQFDGEVLDAKLVGSNHLGWDYDLRVVTEDGHVHRVRYDAATLALRALDGQPIE